MRFPLLLTALLLVAACDAGPDGPGEEPGDSDGAPETVIAIPNALSRAFTTNAGIHSGGQTFYGTGTGVALVGTDGRLRRLLEVSGLSPTAYITSIVSDGAGGVVVAGRSAVNSFTFVTTVIRFDADLDVMWAKSYSPGSYTSVTLVPGNGRNVVVLDLFRAIPLDLVTGEPVAPVAYRQQGVQWTGGRADAGGYTLVGTYQGALLTARHRWTGEREWYRSSEPGDRSTDFLFLGPPAITTAGELVVPYNYVAYVTPNTGVVRIRTDGTVAANWQPEDAGTRAGSRVQTAPDGTVYQTVFVGEESDTHFMYPIGPDGSRIPGPFYGGNVAPQADGSYLYYLNGGLHRGTENGCTPQRTVPFSFAASEGGRPFVLDLQSGDLSDPVAITSSPASVTVADMPLDAVPPPVAAARCARLAG